MGEKRQKFLLSRFYLLYATGVVIVYGALMALVFPWWNASSHSVRLSLGMDKADTVKLSYAEGESVLLQPIGTPDGYHWDWRVELPPRPSYTFALEFPQGSDGEVFFKAIQVTPGIAGKEDGGSLTSATMEDSPDDTIRLQPTLQGLAIYAKAGERLELPVELPSPGAIGWMKDWVKATVGYVLVALILLFILTTLLRFPHGLPSYRRRAAGAEILIVALAALAGGFAHVYLVHHSVPIFTPGQSDPLVMQALVIHQEADPGSALEATPGFGYPWLLSKLAPYGDWNLGIVTLGQGVLFSLSILLVSVAMVRVVQGYILAPVVLLALLSPPAIWASRHIGVQSVLASATLLSLGVFLCLWQREGVLRWIGFVLLGCVMAVAAAVSRQGLLLLILPLGLLIGATWWSLSIRGVEFWKLPVLWTTFGQILIPFVLVVAFPLLAAPPLPELPQAEVVSLGHEVPLQARFVEWGRAAGWGLFLPQRESYGNPLANTDYRVRFGFRSGAEADSVREPLTRMMRLTRQPVHISERKSNTHVVSYNETFVSFYTWFYRLLFFAAIAGWMIGLAERKYLAGILMLPYVTNILAQVFLFEVVNYNIQSLDACLWFGALTGLLCVNPKALQKRTDETDRRCMAPIRPKRLLTRFKKTRRIPLQD